jgi:hypothetical protein
MASKERDASLKNMSVEQRAKIVSWMKPEDRYAAIEAMPQALYPV